MSHNGYIGVRADKALAIIGAKGPLRMSSLLDALGIRTKVAASFKATVQKLVDTEFEWADELSETERGAGGYGSTGR